LIHPAQVSANPDERMAAESWQVNTRSRLVVLVQHTECRMRGFGLCLACKALGLNQHEPEATKQLLYPVRCCKLVEQAILSESLMLAHSAVSPMHQALHRQRAYVVTNKRCALKLLNHMRNARNRIGSGRAIDRTQVVQDTRNKWLISLCRVLQRA
jgi:hypothetical protein